MKAGPRLQNITMSPKGQGLLKQNLQGHKYKKKKKNKDMYLSCHQCFRRLYKDD
jgi:hypothetical protein